MPGVQGRPPGERICRRAFSPSAIRCSEYRSSVNSSKMRRMIATCSGSPPTSVTRWFWMPLRWPGSSTWSGSRFSSNSSRRVPYGGDPPGQ